MFLSAVLIADGAVFGFLCYQVRKRIGKSPMGTIGKRTLFGALLTGASLLWFLLMLLYIFDSQSVDCFWKISVLDNNIAKITGIVMIACGVPIFVCAAKDLGNSFRVAFPEEKTRLVTTGIYSYVRNPMVLYVDVFAIGFLFLFPNLLCLIVVVVNILGYDAKVREEEKYLSRMHGKEYKEYRKKVPWRLIPKVY